MENLPVEVLLLVCRHLSFNDLCNVVLVSKHLYEVASDYSLWRNYVPIINSKALPFFSLPFSSVPRLLMVSEVIIEGGTEDKNLRKVSLEDSDLTGIVSLKHLKLLTVKNCNLSRVTLKWLATMIDSVSSLFLEKSYLTKAQYIQLFKVIRLKGDFDKLSLVCPVYGLQDISPIELASTVVSIRDVTFR